MASAACGVEHTPLYACYKSFTPVMMQHATWLDLYTCIALQCSSIRSAGRSLHATLHQPLPNVHLPLNSECYLCDQSQAYDQHLNMILGEVEETITTVEIDDETYEEIIKVCSAGTV